MRRLVLIAAATVLAMGCRFAPLPLDSSQWPRVDIGGCEYYATSSDAVNKGFDTIKVFAIGAFPSYDRTLAGSLTIAPDPRLYAERSVTIDTSLTASALNPGVTSSVLTVRKWSAEPLDSWKADPAFSFPSPNAYYEFNVADPANPVYLGMGFF